MSGQIPPQPHDSPAFTCGKMRIAIPTYQVFSSMDMTSKINRWLTDGSSRFVAINRWFLLFYASVLTTPTAANQCVSSEVRSPLKCVTVTVSLANFNITTMNLLIYQHNNELVDISTLFQG